MSDASYWLIAALILAGLEMLSGTFYLLAIAIGFASGALAAWAGQGLALQIVLVAIVGVIAVIALHRWKNTHLPAPEANGAMEIGQRVKVLEWLDERHARVQYRGTQWHAELASDAITNLDDYFITAVHGNTLVIHQNQPEK